MSARAFETFLARVYMDAAARVRFKANPREEARSAGLSDEECAALENTDWVGLEMAARSFAHKSERKRENQLRNSFRKTLQNLFASFSALFHRH